MLAITHANNIRLSPKYIGCLTTRYKNLVLIGETIGTTAKLPRNEQSDNNKMIFSSVYSNKKEILKAGADLYLPKPYEIENMINWIKKFLEN